MISFKQFLFEGIWGKVGVEANKIKKKVVRSTFPHTLRVGIASLTSTGKAIGYEKSGQPEKANNMRKWRNEILSGKRKLRG